MAHSKAVFINGSIKQKTAAAAATVAPVAATATATVAAATTTTVAAATATTVATAEAAASLGVL